jgi:hypothetical protein
MTFGMVVADNNGQIVRRNSAQILVADDFQQSTYDENFRYEFGTKSDKIVHMW